MNSISDHHPRMRLLLRLLPLLSLVLVACSSAPQRFYTLAAPAAGSSSAPTVAVPLLIEVLPVTVPAQVDVPQIVVRIGNDELAPVETRRWIAPLAEEIRAALSDDLVRVLAARDVHGIGAGTDAPTYRVAMRITRFESSLGAYARIDASWSITATNKPDGGLACSAGATESIAPGYEALVAGHQRALTAIAEIIAADITALRNGGVAKDCAATLR